MGPALGWPETWVQTVRARRLLFLALCAPGFLAVFTSTWHRSLAVMALGAAAFSAALLWRRYSEPRFLAAAGVFDATANSSPARGAPHA